MNASTSSAREVRVRAGGDVVDGADASCTSPTRRSITVALAVLRRLDACRSASSLRVGLRDRAERARRSARSVFASSNLPGDDEHRVVRLVVLAGRRPAGARSAPLDVGARADRGLAVVVPEVGGRQHPLDEHAAAGCSRPISNSLRTTVISVSRSFLAMKLLTMRSASSSSAHSRFSSVAGERLVVVGAVEPGGAVAPRAVLVELLRDVRDAWACP